MALILVMFQIVKGFHRKHQNTHSPQPAELTLTNPEYQLLEASKAGDLELVKKIVNLHPHIVNCRDLDGKISHHKRSLIDPSVISLEEVILSADSDIIIHHAT